jgi:putative transposase
MKNQNHGGEAVCVCADLTEFEWSVIQPRLPDKSRGVHRVDDRRVLNGILWRLRTGAAWADIPERYGPHMTCVNRFSRWRKAGVWGAILDAIRVAYGEGLTLIDASSLRAHRCVADTALAKPGPVAWLLPDLGGELAPANGAPAQALSAPEGSSPMSAWTMWSI